MAGTKSYQWNGFFKYYKTYKLLYKQSDLSIISVEERQNKFLAGWKVIWSMIKKENSFSRLIILNVFSQ